MFEKMKESFSERCYEILKRVPHGRVTTYKEIARALGTKAYRAVGNAMHRNPKGFLGPKLHNNKTRSFGNRNPYAPKVPCHRVVNSNGNVGGFAFGVKKKTDMLRKEGVDVIDGKVDLKKYFYKF